MHKSVYPTQDTWANMKYFSPLYTLRFDLLVTGSYHIISIILRVCLKYSSQYSILHTCWTCFSNFRCTYHPAPCSHVSMAHTSSSAMLACFHGGALKITFAKHGARDAQAHKWKHPFTYHTEISIWGWTLSNHAGSHPWARRSTNCLFVQLP